MWSARAGIGLFLAGGLAAADPATEARLPEATVEVGGTRLTVEVAVTPGQRAKGLSGRDRLGRDRGMLFVWPGAEPRRFWMKGTRIPLSVAFLDGRGRILNIRRMAVPDPDQDGFRRYPSEGPARFALEAHRGWFAEHGIGPGDRCRFRLPPGVAGSGPLTVGWRKGS